MTLQLSYCAVVSAFFIYYKIVSFSLGGSYEAGIRAVLFENEFYLVQLLLATAVKIPRHSLAGFIEVSLSLLACEDKISNDYLILALNLSCDH